MIMALALCLLTNNMDPRNFTELIIGEIALAKIDPDSERLAPDGVIFNKDSTYECILIHMMLLIVCFVII